MRQRSRLILAAVAAGATGAAYPFVELAWHCRSAMTTSEACVWGRAYFPLTRWVEPLIIAPIAFLLFLFLARVSRRGGKPPSSPA